MKTRMIFAALAGAGLLGAVYVAPAYAQKVSLEDAWKTCLAEASKQVGGQTGETTGTNPQSLAAFKACMTRLGHAEGK